MPKPHHRVYNPFTTKGVSRLVPLAALRPESTPATPTGVSSRDDLSTLFRAQVRS